MQRRPIGCGDLPQPLAADDPQAMPPGAARPRAGAAGARAHHHDQLASRHAALEPGGAPARHRFGLHALVGARHGRDGGPGRRVGPHRHGTPLAVVGGKARRRRDDRAARAVIALRRHPRARGSRARREQVAYLGAAEALDRLVLRRPPLSGCGGRRPGGGRARAEPGSCPGARPPGSPLRPAGSSR